MRNERGNTGCWCRVPTDWFAILWWPNSNLVKLIRHEKAMLTVTEDRYLCEKIAAETSAGLLNNE
jgi:hypothetical protein